MIILDIISGSQVNEGFSLAKYTIYRKYLKELDSLKWWEFGKKRKLNKWLNKWLDKFEVNK